MRNRNSKSTGKWQFDCLASRHKPARLLPCWISEHRRYAFPVNNNTINNHNKNHKKYKPKKQKQKKTLPTGTSLLCSILQKLLEGVFQGQVILLAPFQLAFLSFLSDWVFLIWSLSLPLLMRLSVVFHLSNCLHHIYRLLLFVVLPCYLSSLPQCCLSTLQN